MVSHRWCHTPHRAVRRKAARDRPASVGRADDVTSTRDENRHRGWEWLRPSGREGQARRGKLGRGESAKHPRATSPERSPCCTRDQQEDDTGEHERRYRQRQWRLQRRQRWGIGFGGRFPGSDAGMAGAPPCRTSVSVVVAGGMVVGRLVRMVVMVGAAVHGVDPDLEASVGMGRLRPGTVADRHHQQQGRQRR
jgi:hypothetical protein